MKCENCGQEVETLYGVDNDMLIPFVSEFFEQFKDELIHKQVCHSCCHGSKNCTWTYEKGWEFIYG